MSVLSIYQSFCQCFPLSLLTWNLIRPHVNPQNSPHFSPYVSPHNSLYASPHISLHFSVCQYFCQCFFPFPLHLSHIRSQVNPQNSPHVSPYVRPHNILYASPHLSSHFSVRQSLSQCFPFPLHLSHLESH